MARKSIILVEWKGADRNQRFESFGSIPEFLRMHTEYNKQKSSIYYHIHEKRDVFETKDLLLYQVPYLKS